MQKRQQRELQRNIKIKGSIQTNHQQATYTPNALQSLQHHVAILFGLNQCIFYKFFFSHSQPLTAIKSQQEKSSTIKNLKAFLTLGEGTPHDRAKNVSTFMQDSGSMELCSCDEHKQTSQPRNFAIKHEPRSEEKIFI